MLAGQLKRDIDGRPCERTHVRLLTRVMTKRLEKEKAQKTLLWRIYFWFVFGPFFRAMFWANFMGNVLG